MSGESMNSLMAFHEEMNRLFDVFSRDLDVPSVGLSTNFGFPHVELSDTDKEVKVEAELPGLSDSILRLIRINAPVWSHLARQEGTTPVWFALQLGPPSASSKLDA